MTVSNVTKTFIKSAMQQMNNNSSVRPSVLNIFRIASSAMRPETLNPEGTNPIAEFRSVKPPLSDSGPNHIDKYNFNKYTNFNSSPKPFGRKQASHTPSSSSRSRSILGLTEDQNKQKTTVHALIKLYNNNFSKGNEGILSPPQNTNANTDTDTPTGTSS